MSALNFGFIPFIKAYIILAFSEVSNIFPYVLVCLLFCGNILKTKSTLQFFVIEYFYSCFDLVQIKYCN